MFAGTTLWTSIWRAGGHKRIQKPSLGSQTICVWGLCWEDAVATHDPCLLPIFLPGMSPFLKRCLLVLWSKNLFIEWIENVASFEFEHLHWSLIRMIRSSLGSSWCKNLVRKPHFSVDIPALAFWNQAEALYELLYVRTFLSRLCGFAFQDITTFTLLERWSFVAGCSHQSHLHRHNAGPSLSKKLLWGAQSRGGLWCPSFDIFLLHGCSAILWWSITIWRVLQAQPGTTSSADRQWQPSGLLQNSQTWLLLSICLIIGRSPIFCRLSAPIQFAENVVAFLGRQQQVNRFYIQMTDCMFYICTALCQVSQELEVFWSVARWIEADLSNQRQGQIAHILGEHLIYRACFISYTAPGVSKWFT